MGFYNPIYKNFIPSKMEKENNSDESDFTENEIPDLNSLKRLEFEPKTNIWGINSSSSDDEEGAEYKVKQISNNEWCECSAKAIVGRRCSNRCQACNLIKKRLQHRCFPIKFTKSLRTPFFTEHLYSDGCFWQ